MVTQRGKATWLGKSFTVTARLLTVDRDIIETEETPYFKSYTPPDVDFGSEDGTLSAKDEQFL
jgi:hypothetical protein